MGVDGGGGEMGGTENARDKHCQLDGTGKVTCAGLPAVVGLTSHH